MTFINLAHIILENTDKSAKSKMEAFMEIKRDYYLNKLISHKHNGFIKIISGIRRCGKSYMLFELFYNHLLENGVKENHIISIQLDTREHEKYRNPDKCTSYVKERIQDKDMYYLLLDEVQMMEDFESVLNGFLHIKNLDVYVTGSNSKFLSTDIVTEFRGRGDEIRIHPLSFAEFYAYKNTDWEEAWNEYSVYGGMPALFKFNTDIEKAKYLQNLYKETYLKDIIARNKIQNSEELEELLAVIASNIGSLTNPQKLADTFKSKKHLNITAPTIKNYLSFLEDAFLISKVLRYDIKGKKYINTPAKYYFTDVGLRNAEINFRQQEETHLMENVIYNELTIRGYQVDIGEVIVTEKNASGQKQEKKLEVDFVVNLGSKRYYIQSAYSIPTDEKQKQEEKSLLNIPDGFKKIIIIGGSRKPYYNESGILIVGLKDFLLSPESLDF